MIRAGTVRFFLTVAPAPRWTHVAFVTAVLLGWLTLWFNPREVDSAFGSVLLLQMFAVSNGFAASAARGYFDPILVSGRPRSRIAIGAFIATCLPGVLCWLAITMAAALLGQPRAALAPHRMVALLLVSAGGWAIGLALPRLAGGALWSMLIVALALSQRAFIDILAAAQHPPVGLWQVLRSAAACGVCPFLLLGDRPPVAHPWVLALDVVLALGCVWAGVLHVDRREFPLTEPA